MRAPGIPETRPAAEVLATCAACGTPGPVATLPEHLRVDHTLRGDRLRAWLSLTRTPDGKYTVVGA